MDLHPVDQPVPANARCVEEAKEEHDQPWLAIYEHDPVLPEVGLVLGTLTPVGDGAGDEEFPLGQGADLGSCGCTCRLPVRFAGGAFCLPVAADSVRCTLAALLVAEPIRPGRVMDPVRDRALRDAQFGG